MPLLRDPVPSRRPRSARPRRTAALLNRTYVAAAAMVLLGSPAGAQMLAMAEPPARREADPVVLEARARELVASMGRHRDAARIYLEAAAMRGEADPAAVENRRLAANLFFFAGDEAKSQAAMEGAAEAALALGDVAGAANRFMDAAWVAGKRGIGESAIRLVARARLLTASPLLDAETRRSVLERIDARGAGEIRHTRIPLRTGIELEVAETGREDGVPVLFLHGFTDSWVSFEPVLKRLPAGVRAIVPTQRGHGSSERPECCYGMDAFARDAVAVLDALGIERAVVVGHSMGSFVAQRLAIDHADRVRALMLVGSAATPRNQQTAALMEALNAQVGRVDPGFAREFQQSTVAQSVDSAYIDRVTGESLKLPIRVWCEALAGMLALDATDQLRTIRAPTLVLGGDRDSVFSREEQESLARAIPKAQSTWYTGYGHAPHWESPDRFVGDLMDFVNRQVR